MPPSNELPATHQVCRVLILTAMVGVLGWIAGVGITSGYFREAISEMRSVQTRSWETWKSIFPWGFSDPKPAPTPAPVPSGSPRP